MQPLSVLVTWTLHINVNGAEPAYRQTVMNEAQAPGLPTEMRDPGSDAGSEGKAAAFLSLATLQLLNMKTTVFCQGNDPKKSPSHR